jgi:hypothetical protein
MPSLATRVVALLALAILALGGRVAAQNPAAPAAATGRIAGKVVDASSGRALQGVQVEVVGQTGRVETDLDGRFRTAALPVGAYSVIARQLGYKPARADSVRVTAGQSTVISLALTVSTVQLEELAVVSEKPAAAASDAGLYAEQKNAEGVSDGISAETINEDGDSDAGQALTRVSGVAVQDDKVVVRGLSERYSTSVLNGVQVSSPEPDKQLVPLDAFPSSLLEAIVVQKTATPDKPANFAGGSADIRTKEFPERTSFSVQVKGGYNSNGTFETSPFAPWRGASAVPAPNPDPVVFSQGFANVWTPASSTALPLGDFQASLGSSFEFGGNALGFTLAANAGAGRNYNPSLYSGLGSGTYTYQVASSVTDFGGIANFSLRLGTRNKLSFKNFYTSGSTSTATQGAGARFDPADAAVRLYQMFFISRYIYQGLLVGEHLLPNGRLEWRLGYGRAGRSDNDNRQLNYISFASGPGFQLADQFPNYRYQYDFNDVTKQGDFSYAVPIKLREEGDGEFKMGALGRFTNRELNGTAFQMITGSSPLATRLLPPEQAFAAENLGATVDGLIEIRPTSGVIIPYLGTDDVFAVFGMADLQVLRRLRMVAGVRLEDWNASVQTTDSVVAQSVIEKSKTDWLPSINLTYSLSAASNLRASFAKTVVRPELREFAPGGYPPVVGGLFELGNVGLEPGTIWNEDLRFETYPAAGQVLSAGVFAKQFNNPIVAIVQFQSGEFVSQPVNAVSGSVLGIELESRTSLRYIGSTWRNFSLGVNLSLVRSRITLPDSLGVFSPDLQFQGQSPYLINVGLTYETPQRGVTATVLFNRFGDRVFRYGGLTGQSQGPNIVETARNTLDAKVSWAVAPNWVLAVNGKNLTNPNVQFVTDETPEQRIIGLTKVGIDLSVAVTYAF